jgi:plastocyanin
MTRLILLAASLLLAVLLAACNGGVTAPQAVNLTFDGNDAFEFIPATAEAPAGAEVTVTFNNVGVLEHTWTLIPPGLDPLIATEVDMLGTAGSGVVAGGETVTFAFQAPEAGAYIFVCTIPGHAAGGMVGTLIVTGN